MEKILKEIRAKLTVDVWPTAGKALGYRTKGAAYAAARRGAMRTVEDDGRRRQVPTAWLRRVLCLDEPAPRRRPRRKRRQHEAAAQAETATI
jgi:hypothetical protein